MPLLAFVHALDNTHKLKGKLAWLDGPKQSAEKASREELEDVQRFGLGMASLLSAGAVMRLPGCYGRPCSWQVG